MLVYDWMWWGHLTNQNFAQRYAGFLLDNMLSLWVCILLEHTIKEESIIAGSLESANCWLVRVS